MSERFGPPATPPASFVYANYIASLDGRISLPDPQTAKRGVPPAIANDRDWRLFQELTARADALLVSGRYVRDLKQGATSRGFPVSGEPAYADLLRWRTEHGLAPQPAVVIVSASLDLPPLRALAESGRRVYVATGRTADARRIASVRDQGVRVLLVGSGARVEGRRLVAALADESLRNVAMIGGGEMLHALAADDALDRLYLTLALKLVGGMAFDTLLTGPVLEPARGFTLTALHYDAPADGAAGLAQLFAILDRKA